MRFLGSGSGSSNDKNPYYGGRYYNKWLLGYGYTNGLRRTLAPTASETVTLQTRPDADFILDKLIGDMEVAAGADRDKILVDIQIGDSQESLFSSPLPFDQIFGTPQFPNVITERLIVSFTRVFITVYNNNTAPGQNLEYNWLFQGFNNYFGNNQNKKELEKGVFQLGRESALTWNQDSSGNAVPGGVFTIPVAPAGTFASVQATSQQFIYPFLVRDIRTSGAAIPADVYLNLTDLTGNHDTWFNDFVLARMVLGNAGQPFLLDEFRPYQPTSFIEINIRNYDTLSAHKLPISLWGIRGPNQGAWDINEYIMQAPSMNIEAKYVDTV